MPGASSGGGGKGMCSVVILRRIGHRWPLLIGANRDEMVDRPSSPPGRHWPDRPAVIAPRDNLAGGTWIGINDRGVVAAVLNRRNTLGPSPGRRSRGELPLIALGCRDARTAARAVTDIDLAAYRSFNMIICDRRDALWLSVTETARGDDVAGPVDAATAHLRDVPEGVSMITAYDLNDVASPRIRHHLPKFAVAPAPEPERGEWRSWSTLIASRDAEANAGAGGAMTVVTETGFETTSSSLLALPAAEMAARPVWLFADGRPDRVPYRPVVL